MIRWALAAMLIVSGRCALAQASHLDLSVEIDTTTGEFRADALITPAPVSRFEFALAQGLSVGEVTLDGRDVAFKRMPGAKFAVEIAHPAGKLGVRYGGTLPNLNAALSHGDVPGVLPPMVSTEGSYLPASGGWYPDPGRTFTYRLDVRTPNGQIAVAPGTAVREAIEARHRQAVFEFAHPIEGIDLMIGPYTVTERVINSDGKRIRLRTYFHPGLEILAEPYLSASGAFVERYSREIGTYPYSDFSVVSSPLPTGFGMPTLTYLGREVLRLPFIRDISLGHEVLHNWWGNGVFVDPARGNWSEGLTTFMADYAYNEDAGPDAARDMRHGWLRDLLAIAPESEQPLSEFRARHHVASSAVGYGKAAMLFYTLRERLGAERFHRALRQFWREFQFNEASFDDLRRAFERASGERLEAFFVQWLDRTGAPDLRIRAAKLSATNSKLRLTLTLVQDHADRSSRVPVRMLYDARHRDTNVDVSGSTTTVASSVDPGLRSVQLDPDFTVWRKLLPAESPPILRDAVAAPRLNVLVLDPTLKAGAMKLAAAFAEGEARAVSSAEAAGLMDALLVVGNATAVDDYLRAHDLPARPGDLAAGEIQCWAIPNPESRIVIASLPTDTDAAIAALSQLARRVPHLSRYSWVTFQDNRIAGRGDWPAITPTIPVQ